MSAAGGRESADLRSDALREALRDALRAVERDDGQRFEQALARLDDRTARPMYSALIRVQRELCDALGSIPAEARLAEMAGRELPSARERLEFALDSAEKAAHRTLDIADAMRAEVTRIAELLPVPATAVAAMQKHLSALCEAQSYQDITGQVIRRVVDVVGRAERALNEAVAATGIEAANEASACVGDGRVTARVDRVASQTDADDLLAGLGL
jgi:chemotaxis protein CheZ